MRRPHPGSVPTQRGRPPGFGVGFRVCTEVPCVCAFWRGEDPRVGGLLGLRASHDFHLVNCPCRVVRRPQAGVQTLPGGARVCCCGCCAPGTPRVGFPGTGLTLQAPARLPAAPLRGRASHLGHRPGDQKPPHSQGDLVVWVMLTLLQEKCTLPKTPRNSCQITLPTKHNCGHVPVSKERRHSGESRGRARWLLTRRRGSRLAL